MCSKFTIVLTCLATVASLADAGNVIAANIRVATRQGLQNACSETIRNCQTGLSQVSGVGFLSALLMNLSLQVLILTLLGNVVSTLTPLLATSAPSVVELLGTVLAAIAEIVGSACDFLSESMSQPDYTYECNNWKQRTDATVKSYGNGTLGVCLPDILGLVQSLVTLCVSARLGL